MTIGERISQLRKEKKMSQGQLASALEVSRQAVSKWENNQSSPDTLNLIRLSELLDTEVEYLATGEKPEYLPAPIVVNLVEKKNKYVDRIIEKPVVKKVVRIRYRRNPVEYIFLSIVCLIVGFLIGKFI